MKYIERILAIVVVVFLGCATNQSEQSYVDSVLNRPMPANEGQRIQECNWIRSEIARQQGLAGYGASIATSLQMAALYQAVAQRNIAALQSRAANIQCTASFSNAPAVSSKLNFDQCFSRCQQYTSRTKEECFDTCNK
jgi:hypothetical protein